MALVIREKEKFIDNLVSYWTTIYNIQENIVIYRKNSLINNLDEDQIWFLKKIYKYYAQSFINNYISQYKNAKKAIQFFEYDINIKIFGFIIYENKFRDLKNMSIIYIFEKFLKYSFLELKKRKITYKNSYNYFSYKNILNQLTLQFFSQILFEFSAIYLNIDLKIYKTYKRIEKNVLNTWIMTQIYDFFIEYKIILKDASNIKFQDNFLIFCLYYYLDNFLDKKK